MNAPGNHSFAQQSSLRNDTNLLPHFLEILDCAQNNRSAQEINKKFLNFKAKVKQCRIAIEKVKGLEINNDDQMETLQNYEWQLEQKGALLDKYSNLKAMSSALKQ